MPDPEVIPPQPTAPTPTSFLPANAIFHGPNGIRAGWRVLLFLALVVLVTLVFITPFVAMRALRGGAGPQVGIGVGGLTPLGLSISEGTLFLIPSIPALIMARIERRKY